MGVRGGGGGGGVSESSFAWLVQFIWANVKTQTTEPGSRSQSVVVSIIFFSFSKNHSFVVKSNNNIIYDG